MEIHIYGRAECLIIDCKTMEKKTWRRCETLTLCTSLQNM